MALNVITWLWGNKYTPNDVSRLAKAVNANLSIAHKFTVFTDKHHPSFSAREEVKLIDTQDHRLMTRSCFVRLRMFDPAWQRRHGFNDRIVSLDLDNVIVGRLDDLFADNGSSFMILQGVNAVNPNPFNASVMMLRAGQHADVWSDFSPEKAEEAPYHEFPDDQGWIHHKLPGADGWKAGKQSGIYGFKKPGWPGGTAMPMGAKMICFIGHRKPEHYPGVWWIRQYWTQA